MESILVYGFITCCIVVSYIFEYNRKKGLRNARKVISDDKLIKLIHATRRFTSLNHGQVTASSCLVGELHRGRTLDDIFSAYSPRYRLSVKKITEQKFGLSLGCRVGPLTGDSGYWEATFDEHENIQYIELKSTIIS